MRENSGVVPGPKPYLLSDFPGHSFCQEALISRCKTAAGVVMLIDSSDKPSFKAAARQLYGIIELKSPKNILIFCNKQDLPLAKKTLLVESDLSTEMYPLCRERLKLSKGETTDEIGRVGERFEFPHTQDQGISIKLAEGSLSSNDFQEIPLFISKLI